VAVGQVEHERHLRSLAAAPYRGDDAGRRITDHR